MVLLIKAVRDGRILQVKLLLKAGVNVNLTDKNGQTALMHCCFLDKERTRMTLVKRLAANGVDPNKRDKFGRGFVSWACVFGRVDILHFVLNGSSMELNFSTVDNSGNSALFLAVMSGRLEMVKFVLKMLQKTCSLDDIHRANNAGIRPLLAAFHRGDKDCARLLITEGGAPVSSVIKYLTELANDGITDPLKIHPFYVFMAKSRDLKVNLLDSNPHVPTKKDLLGFLSAKDDTLYPSRPNKTRTGAIKHCSSQNKNSLLDVSSTTIGMNSRHSQDILDMKESVAGSDTQAPGYSKFHISMATDFISEDSKKFSSQESVLQLYDIYKEQLTDSYREGMPMCRYRIPTPPPPPRKYSKARSNKRGSLTSSSGSLPSVHESALDKQLRMRHARSNRAVSVQVAKLPPIPGNLRKLKKTKSSASFKLRS